MDFDFNDDETSDWLDNESDRAYQPVYRYCLTCGRIVATMSDKDEFHTVVWTDGDEYGCETFVEPCYGPFTTSTPPDNFGENWDIDLVEPDGDEMFIINHNAEQLLADFE